MKLLFLYITYFEEASRASQPVQRKWWMHQFLLRTVTTRDNRTTRLIKQQPQG